MTEQINAYLDAAEQNVKETAALINGADGQIEMATSKGNRAQIMRLFADAEAGAFYCSQDKGSKTETHRHSESVEYFIVVTGTILCLGEVYSEGECCIVPPDTPHSVEALHGSRASQFMAFRGALRISI